MTITCPSWNASAVVPLGNMVNHWLLKFSCSAGEICCSCGVYLCSLARCYTFEYLAAWLQWKMTTVLMPSFLLFCSADRRTTKHCLSSFRDNHFYITLVKSLHFLFELALTDIYRAILSPFLCAYVCASLCFVMYFRSWMLKCRYDVWDLLSFWPAAWAMHIISLALRSFPSFY